MTRATITLAATLLLAAPAQAAAPHLFIDRHLIAHTADVKRVVEQPRKHPRPVTRPEHGNFQPYSSVFQLAPRRFRLYYDALVNDEEGDGTSRAAFAESADGVHWGKRRLLDLPTPNWGANIVRIGDGFRYLWWNQGMWLADSPDGVHWNNIRQGRSDVSDIVSMTRFRGRWVAPVKMMRGGYVRGGREADGVGLRRTVSLTTSRDGLRWTQPRPMFLPDRDPGVTEFYGLGGMVKRGGLLIGFLRVLRDDLPATVGGPREGVGYTVLAWTRDGIRWHRDRAPFLSRGPDGWDHAMAWADTQIQVGRQTWIYYGGYRQGHKINRETERQIGIAKMPLDRYVARASRRGVLVTRPIRAGRFLLNARVRGTLKVRAVGRSAGCDIGRGNYVYRRVCDLPTGRYRLRFELQHARVYGFQP